jgi:hypothetical protein
MDCSFYYHRFANLLVDGVDEFSIDFNEIITVLNSITDEDLINDFNERKLSRSSTKSLSESINKLLKVRLTELGWIAESPIFREEPYDSTNNSAWRLDFAKNNISIEVAFNHGEAIAHNIIKPVLASELNHVQKNIQTKLGVIITTNEDMKRKGGFDGAVGTFEKFISYFKPYSNIVTTPIVLIGLKEPKTFEIVNKEVIYY